MSPTLNDQDFVEYVIISSRLAGDIVSKHEAGRPRKRNVPSIGVKGVSVQRTEVQPNLENRFDLASRAAEIVSPLTGLIDAPGEYVQGVLDFEEAVVAIHIGFEGMNQRVASFFADEIVPDVGRVFVALFGSTHNLLGWARQDPAVIDRHPSDARGLYQLLDASLEAKDSKVDRRHMKDDRRATDLVRLDAAYGIAYRHRKHLEISGTYQYLAKVHLRCEQVELDKISYDVVLLGAPIWIKTPGPQPL